MSEWRTIVNDNLVLGQDDGLYDVTTVDTFNPFGSFAIAKFEDLEGGLFDVFERGTKFEVEYNSLNSDGFESIFIGYVVQVPSVASAGSEELTVKAFTFDQFLRGNQVTTDLVGSTISDALETVIDNDVPAVDFVADQIEVVDDKELTEVDTHRARHHQQ